MIAATKATGTVRSTVDVELQSACEADRLPRLKDIRRWIEAALRSTGHPAEGCGVVVRVVGEAESRELNNRFRQKDSSTNVLAFPAAGDGELPGLPMQGRGRTLGDLVICAPVLEREASEQGKALDAHWAHLLVHGTLHLLGYDHQSAPETGEMERLEVRVLRQLGISDPYA